MSKYIGYVKKVLDEHLREARNPSREGFTVDHTNGELVAKVPFLALADNVRTFVYGEGSKHKGKEGASLSPRYGFSETHLLDGIPVTVVCEVYIGVDQLADYHKGDEPGDDGTEDNEGILGKAKASAKKACVELDGVKVELPAAVVNGEYPRVEVDEDGDLPDTPGNRAILAAVKKVSTLKGKVSVELLKTYRLKQGRPKGS